MSFDIHDSHRKDAREAAIELTSMHRNTTPHIDGRDGATPQCGV
jgi:hypothetical protein